MPAPISPMPTGSVTRTRSYGLTLAFEFTGLDRMRLEGGWRDPVAWAGRVDDEVDDRGTDEYSADRVGRVVHMRSDDGARDAERNHGEQRREQSAAVEYQPGEHRTRGGGCCVRRREHGAGEAHE